ncbi:glycoside hydrolase family 65 protein [Enterococcus sp. CWB-B31]|uniref:glycoside hydrolase family 65 protein n=1 Tax=Enterococcus sp. CWB-B31 TaxID=2885159 RepID=UPI001E5CF0B9|nr:glycoside hydrolase family 65 protein [Enterococcus sp. CWB-B31]MCB5956471.1 glycoside hydrolase family 65 protein [Enterococcus sp. CWB-B31]
MYKRLFEIDPWKIATNQLDRENKRLMESLTSIGNGYMGMRGMFEETYSGDSHQGLYLAGIWYPDKTRVGWWKNGYPDYFGKVINAVNFIAVDITINGTVLDLAKQDVKDFYMELDMKNGLLKRTFVYEEAENKVAFSFERFVSIVDKELGFVRVKAEVLSGNPEIRVFSKVDGNVRNEDSNYDEMFWEEKQRENQDGINYLMMETIPNAFEVPRFTVTTVMKNKISESVEGQRVSEILLVGDQFTWSGNIGQMFTLEKTIAVVTSRDVPEENQLTAAKELLTAGLSQTFDQHLEKQEAAWEERWHKADVQIIGDDEAQQGIRFNLFQLFSTYYGEDERLNVGPKGFTGEKYGGATYWDTEAYIVPMYLSVTEPKVTRKLLEYRYKQLDGALINAQRQGLKGALYPMVTFTGVECHNEWEITFEEIHRNGSMVHAIADYTNYTGDETYLLKDGIKVVVNIARFWADRVHYSKRVQKYMIHGVTGPNEYDNNVSNNWFTNYIASWCLKYALDNIDRAYTESKHELNVSADEKEKWQDIIDHMYYPYDEELDVFVQHDTFLDKDLMPVSDLRPEDRPLNQHWSWDRILRSCFIKQADVLQGVYFFGDQFTREEKERNFNFYEPMTVHESSLSPCVHAILAAELGQEEKAVDLYKRTARLDLDNYNNDTDDGLHITSMSGSWLAIVQGFAGMRTYDGQLTFNPFLPKMWQGYSFAINYRGRLISIAVNSETVALELVEGEELSLSIYEKEMTLREKITVPIRKEETVD